MAVAAMVKRNFRLNHDGIGYRFSEVITDGATGNDIHIPSLPPGKTPTVVIRAGAGSGNVEFTMSDDDDVLAGTATWDQYWPLGASTGTVADTLEGTVTGIRGVSISGEITIEVVI